MLRELVDAEREHRTITVHLMAAPVTRTERIELRAQPARARRIRHAARLLDKSVSAFVLDAAIESAERVISEATQTEVPSRFFDDLWRALGALPEPNAALVKRAAARRRVAQR